MLSSRLVAGCAAFLASALVSVLAEGVVSESNHPAWAGTAMTLQPSISRAAKGTLRIAETTMGAAFKETLPRLCQPPSKQTLKNICAYRSTAESAIMTCDSCREML